MKSQKKQLLILAVLFVFLLVSYITLQTYNEKEAEMETEENIFVITEFTADEVVSFSYDYEGMTYAYTLDGYVWIGFSIKNNYNYLVRWKPEDHKDWSL